MLVLYYQTLVFIYKLWQTPAIVQMHSLFDRVVNYSWYDYNNDTRDVIFIIIVPE